MKASPTASVTAAFLVIGVIILARHAGSLESAIAWLGAPVTKQASG